MKVSIAVKGRFHAFFLARELQSTNLLNQLITSYPIFKTQEYGIQKKYVRSLLLNELLERAIKKSPFDFLKSNCVDAFFHEMFDWRTNHAIKTNSSIFVGWSGSSLYSFKKLKNTPIRLVLENGSTHALYQQKILEEEYLMHGLTYHSNQNIIQKKLKEYDLCDYISLPSQFTKNSFLQYGIPEKKIIQVPYGVDVTQFYPQPKLDKKFRIIFCGNVSLRKGIQYLLKAFYELKLPNSELYVIGPVASELDSLVKKYKADNVVWAGSFRENKLVHEYAKGDLFCLPSIEEGLALVIPQVMACGLPVICTTNTGGEDIIQHGKEGFFVPIRNVDALKEKILLLYGNEALRTEMGMRAMNTIRDRYTWEHYGKRMIAEYQRL